MINLDLQKKFSRCLELLGDGAPEILADFFTFQKSQAAPMDSLTYFPMWLRERRVSEVVVEVAFWESIQAEQQRALLQNSKSSLRPRRAVIRLNPTLQRIRIQLAEEILQQPPGIYYFCTHQNRVFQRKVSEIEERLLDRLSEDVLFIESEMITPQEHQAFANLVNSHFILMPD